MNTHGPLRIEVFNDGMFFENGMLLWVDGEPDGWIIDPGLPPQDAHIAKEIEAQGLTRLAVVLTHCHADHIAGIGPLKQKFDDMPVVCPVGEVEMLTDPETNLSASFGIPIAQAEPEQTISAGETLQLGPLVWNVLDVAGHSPGGLAYYCAAAGVALVGDALFAEGIGRYDFPTSNREQLLRNIEENLLSLPDETIIYPGHGPSRSIGEIKVGNMTLLGELSRLGE